MSRVRTTITCLHLESGLVLNGKRLRTTDFDTFESDILTATTSYQVVDLGAVITPMQIGFKHVSGDAVQIGMSTSDYPFLVNGAGDSLLLRLDVETIVEKSTVTAIASVADSLSGVYFDIFDRSGTVRVWINTGASTPPSTPGGGRLLPVVTTSDAVAANVAIALAAALNADSQFSASIDATGLIVTITNLHTGTRSTISAGTSGMAVASVQTGAASPSVYFKSVGTSEVVVSVTSA